MMILPSFVFVNKYMAMYCHIPRMPIKHHFHCVYHTNVFLSQKVQ